MNDILSILLLAPLAACGLIILLPETWVREIRAAAIASALVPAFCSLFLYGVALAAGDGFRFAMDIPWVPAWGLSLHLCVDAFSLPMLLLTSVVGLAAMLASAQPDRPKAYYLLLTVVLGTSLAAFVSRNLFFFYFFCEVATIPKFLLTSIWGLLPEGKYRTTPKFAAMQVTLFIAFGAMTVLLAMSLLYYVGGQTMDLDTLRDQVAVTPLSLGVQQWIFGALLVGFGIWSSMWPFHTWSPLTYATMPAPAAMLFAGVAKNFGVYALLRIGLDVLPQGAQSFAQPLAVIATINIIYGGFVAMRQADWNYIIAYSSISHMGYLLLALAAAMSPGGAGAASAVVFFMVAHGLIVALFFLLSDCLQKTAGSRFVGDLGGLARTMPFLGVAFAVAVIAGSGLPGFANFVAEVMVFIVSWSEGSVAFRVGAIAAVWGVVMTATYLFRALRSTFHGEARGERAPSPPPGLSVRLAILVLVLSSVAAGLWPRLLTDLNYSEPVAAQQKAVGP